MPELTFGMAVVEACFGLFFEISVSFVVIFEISAETADISRHASTGLQDCSLVAFASSAHEQECRSSSIPYSSTFADVGF